MPRGDKNAYTDKQKRQAAHIAEGYEERGVAHDEAEGRAWATVNERTGGGRKSGAGHATTVSGGRSGGAASALARSASARKAATRKRNAAAT